MILNSVKLIPDGRGVERIKVSDLLAAAFQKESLMTVVWRSQNLQRILRYHHVNSLEEIHGKDCKVLHLASTALKQELRERSVKLSYLASITFPKHWLPSFRVEND